MAAVKQDGRVNVRFRVQEVTRIRALAERHGLTVSDLVRLWAYRGLRRRIVPEHVRAVEAVDELAKVRDV